MPFSPTVKVPNGIGRGNATVLGHGSVGLTHAVKELCRTNFLVFQKVELGYEIGPQHKLWWQHLQEGRDVIELAPRDHGKSHSLARAYPLWRLKYDPWVQDVLVLGADQPSAVENLDKIKKLMEAADTCRYLLPQGRSMTNSRTEMALTNGKVIKTKGLMSPLRGRHPQLIVCDDILNEGNSWSQDSRKDIKNYFNEVIVPMKDKGMRKKGQIEPPKSKIVIVGTAQDLDDLYHECLSNGEYIGEKLSAIVDDEKRLSLWPERYNYDDLMATKRRVGPLSFSKEYLNKPMTDETTIFPSSLFDPLKDKNRSYVQNYKGNLMVALGADFSIPGSVDGDWTVILVIAYDPEVNLYYLLNYWRAKPANIFEQMRQIEYYCQTYRVTKGLLEDNMFQGIYREHFKNKTTLPLQGHTVTGQKKRSLETGILSLRTIFENGQFVFPYRTEADQQKTDHVISEFSGVRQKHGKIGNETTHDDTVMAMWHAIVASRQTQFEADFG